MSEAIRIIKAEHSAIWWVLDTLEHVCEEARRREEEEPDGTLFHLILDFLENYPDRLHHPKEDSYLFRYLRERRPESEPLIAELESQHERGPELAKEVNARLATYIRDFPAGAEAFADAVHRYAEFQRNHIRVEEQKILPLARDSLLEEDWEVIDEAFRRNDNPAFGKSVQTEFLQLQSRIVNYAPAPYGLGLEHRPGVTPAAETVALQLEGVGSHYGPVQALKGVDLDVPKGKLVALVGANGAGKTTLLRTISGLQPQSAGAIRYEGRDISGMRCDRRVALGICQVPEGRQLFGPMTVEDNLRLGAYARRKEARIDEELASIYETFPILRQKRREAAGTLSGGQQQMLAIGRALMARPRVLLLDEPSMGLAPLLVAEIFNIVAKLKEQGITILLVEQNAAVALAIADRAYVIETGRIVLSGTGPELLDDEKVKAAYLGM